MTLQSPCNPIAADLTDRERLDLIIARTERLLEAAREKGAEWAIPSLERTLVKLRAERDAIKETAA